MFLSLLLLLVVCCSGSIEAQRIMKNPIDKYAKLNSNVFFECLVDGYNGDTDLVEWCKNNFCTWGRPVELSDGRLKFMNKYYIVGNRLNGEFNLLIENVTLSDVGDYKCKYTRRFLTDATVHKQAAPRRGPLRIESNVASLKIMSEL